MPTKKLVEDVTEEDIMKDLEKTEKVEEPEVFKAPTEYELLKAEYDALTGIIKDADARIRNILASNGRVWTVGDIERGIVDELKRIEAFLK